MMLGSFSPDGNLTSLPVEILQFQAHDLPGPESQSGQKQQDRLVPPSSYTFQITGSEDALDLLGSERFGKLR
jgi:hypothetical protein